MRIATTASRGTRCVSLEGGSAGDGADRSVQGEISALINLARTLGGFAVAYFQVPWAEKYGALQTFGVEAA